MQVSYIVLLQLPVVCLVPLQRSMCKLASPGNMTPLGTVITAWCHKGPGYPSSLIPRLTSITKKRERRKSVHKHVLYRLHWNVMSRVDEAVNIVAFTRNVCISITVSVTQWLTVVLSCYELMQTKNKH